MKHLIVAISACLIAASGCKPGGNAGSAESVASASDQVVHVDDMSPPDSPGDIMAPTAAPEPEVDAGTEAVLQACLERESGPPPANEKPPVNAKGLYANTGECRGCSLGWWHTAQATTLYVDPDFESDQVRSVLAGSWLYAIETVSFRTPARGVVVKSGGKFNECDTVYHVFTSYDEGDSWDTVWRQGEQLSYDESEGARIHWIDGLPFIDLYNDDGWWVRLQGRDDEAGWAWATAREQEFACKWERDPEEICASAPEIKPTHQ